MRIKILKDLTVGIASGKTMSFKEGRIVEVGEKLGNDLLIMQVAERYYQEPAVKIANRMHAAKVSMK